jgi:hypothetical protein
VSAQCHAAGLIEEGAGIAERNLYGGRGLRFRLTRLSASTLGASAARSAGRPSSKTRRGRPSELPNSPTDLASHLKSGSQDGD